MPGTLLFGGAGIGASLGRILVAKQQNVHLLGRNGYFLESLGRELNCKHTVCDVMEGDQETSIKKAIKEAVSEMSFISS